LELPEGALDPGSAEARQANRTGAAADEVLYPGIRDWPAALTIVEMSGREAEYTRKLPVDPVTRLLDDQPAIPEHRRGKARNPRGLAAGRRGESGAELALLDAGDFDDRIRAPAEHVEGDPESHGTSKGLCRPCRRRVTPWRTPVQSGAARDRTIRSND